MTANANTKNISEIAGDDVGALVVDCGHHATRVGYAGEDCPKQLWTSCAGFLSDQTDDSVSQKLVFPLNFHTKRKGLDVKPLFFKNGKSLAINEDVFERVVAVTCEGAASLRVGGLGVDMEDHPVLLTEPSKHNRVVREKMVEVLFECFDVPAAYLAKRAVLSAFAVGRASGLVVDIGASGMSLVPVTEGYSLQKNLFEYPIGGDLLDEQFASLLAQRKYHVDPTYGVYKTARDLGKPLRVFKRDISDVQPMYLKYSQAEVVRNLKECVCRVAEDDNDIAEASTPEPVFSDSGSASAFALSSGLFHELPDGTRIESNPFTYRVPEMLFKPSLIRVGGSSSCQPGSLKGFQGLHVAIANCIHACDVDLRRDLLNAIIMTGGTSLLPGLPDRISRVLQDDETLLGGAARFKVVAPSTAIERRFSSWIGGSILASLGTFQQMWFSLDEYREHGAQLVERKCA